MYDSLQILAHELRLFGIHGSLERRCHESMAENLHPSELVRHLLEDERLQRKQAAAKRLVKRAKFRTTCELEDWDRSFNRGLNKAKIDELSVLNFYHKEQNLIIAGNTGVGKTHLAIALGRRLCNEGIATAFYSTNLLFEEANAEKAAGQYLKLIQRIASHRVLILDDFALRNYTHEEANILLEIIEERYRKGTIIVTSQVDSAGWKGLFEDPVIGEAIVDRLRNPSEEITLKGESYRKKLAGSLKDE